MLKNVDPLLSPELLARLAEMGHGDVLALVDRNFPAASTAKRLVTLPGIDVPTAAAAILTVLPIDTFVDPAVTRMAAVDDPEALLGVHADLQAAVDHAERRTVMTGALDRFEFYRRAKEAYVVVWTSEARPYGCFLLTKGVV